MFVVIMSLRVVTPIPLSSRDQGRIFVIKKINEFCFPKYTNGIANVSYFWSSNYIWICFNIFLKKLQEISKINVYFGYFPMCMVSVHIYISLVDLNWFYKYFSPELFLYMLTIFVVYTLWFNLNYKLELHKNGRPYFNHF